MLCNANTVKIDFHTWIGTLTRFADDEEVDPAVAAAADREDDDDGGGEVNFEELSPPR